MVDQPVEVRVLLLEQKIEHMTEALQTMKDQSQYVMSDFSNQKERILLLEERLKVMNEALSEMKREMNEQIGELRAEVREGLQRMDERVDELAVMMKLLVENSKNSNDFWSNFRNQFLFPLLLALIVGFGGWFFSNALNDNTTSQTTTTNAR